MNILLESKSSISKAEKSILFYFCKLSNLQSILKDGIPVDEFKELQNVYSTYKESRYSSEDGSIRLSINGTQLQNDNVNISDGNVSISNFIIQIDILKDNESDPVPISFLNILIPRITEKFNNITVNTVEEFTDNVSVSDQKPNEDRKVPLGLKPVSSVAISTSGLDIIKQFEGFRSREYICPGGKTTIGYGTVIKPDSYPNGITQAEAESLMKARVSKFEESVRKMVKVPITQNQFSALVSLAYNIGAGSPDTNKGLYNSEVIKRLNQKDYQGAADAFLKFTKSKGLNLAGLEKRRKKERELFLKT